MQPKPELTPYVQSIRVFQSEVGIPASDRSFIPPDGCSKLLFHLENSVEFWTAGKLRIANENGLYFLGNRDSPAQVGPTECPIGFIQIVFAPHGAFPLFGIPMRETADGFFTGDLIFPVVRHTHSFCVLDPCFLSGAGWWEAGE